MTVAQRPSGELLQRLVPVLAHVEVDLRDRPDAGIGLDVEQQQNPGGGCRPARHEDVVLVFSVNTFTTR